MTPSPGAKSSKSLRGTARKAKSENALAAYQSMASGYPLLEGLDVILHDRAAGLMCGTSSWGLLSVWSAELSALAAAVSYGEDNDGAVGIDSCEGLLKDKMQDKAATLPFYRAKYVSSQTTPRFQILANSIRAPSRSPHFPSLRFPLAAWQDQSF